MKILCHYCNKLFDASKSHVCNNELEVIDKALQKEVKIKIKITVMDLEKNNGIIYSDCCKFCKKADNIPENNEIALRIYNNNLRDLLSAGDNFCMIHEKMVDNSQLCFKFEGVEES